MSVSAGIVGLPNVGKSTIFNALSNAGAESANYPFCTIEPNVGIVPVPDPRLEVIQKHIKTQKVIPAVVEILDIAGLVKGASDNEGLGNKFLANIRETDAILHVVRCFRDSNVVHVEGDVNPIRDIEIIETELIFSDIQTIEKRLEKARRAAKGQDKKEKERVEVLEKALSTLTDLKPVRSMDLNERELELLYDSHLLTAKKVLYVANVNEEDLAGKSDLVQEVRDYAKKHDSEVCVVCGAIEAELMELDEAERYEMLQELGIEEPALNVLIRATYKLLNLESYFTAGEKEVRAWTISVGSTAPQAAGVIHSDFEKHFIRAEVYTVEDLESYGSEAGIRNAGKMRLEGKEYVVQDGDIMHFRHSA